MLAVLHLGTVMETAVRFGSALGETSEKMAVSAYVSEYGGEDPSLAGALSAVYASGRVRTMAGNTRAVKNISFFQSSFLEEDEMIHLVMTYRIRTPIRGLPLPRAFFLQRASVRGWTGRSGSEGRAEDGETAAGEMYYVTENGTVYHRDLSCTHIRLSVRKVGLGAVGGMRSRDGEKYHACELCGDQAGGIVYVTDRGNRYHSSLGCSGLKRTVREVAAEDIGDLPPCSRCGG